MNAQKGAFCMTGSRGPGKGTPLGSARFNAGLCVGGSRDRAQTDACISTARGRCEWRVWVLRCCRTVSSLFWASASRASATRARASAASARFPSASARERDASSAAARPCAASGAGRAAVGALSGVKPSPAVADALAGAQRACAASYSIPTASHAPCGSCSPPGPREGRRRRHRSAPPHAAANVSAPEANVVWMGMTPPCLAPRGRHTRALYGARPQVYRRGAESGVRGTARAQPTWRCPVRGSTGMMKLETYNRQTGATETVEYTDTRSREATGKRPRGPPSAGAMWAREGGGRGCCQ